MKLKQILIPIWFIAFLFLMLFIIPFSELVISFLLEESFYYVENPFLHYLHLLLLVVSIGVFKVVKQKANKKLAIKTLQPFIRFFIILQLGFALGYLIHLYSVKQHMEKYGSLFYLEDSYFYFITDFGLILAFIIGGLQLRKKLHFE